MSSNHFSSETEDNYFIKILVPAVCGGAIIGKGGEALIKAQKETGTKVQMSKLNGYYPGTYERICLIQGDPESICKMIEHLVNCIADAKVESANHDKHYQIKMLIPNTSAGFLIGKEGESINEIKKSSGAYIQISPKSNNRNLVERFVIISGEEDQVRNATKLVLNKIKQDPKLCYYPNVSYDDIIGVNSYGNQYGMNLPSPPYNTFVYDNSSLAYPDNINQNYYSAQPSSHFSNSRSFTSSFQQLDLMATDSIHGITRTLEIDEAFVGSIIGPKGKSIVELQEITDTNIKLSKKPVNGSDVNGKRLVTICGMYGSVSRAYLLINDKIQLEKAKRDLSPVDITFNES